MPFGGPLEFQGVVRSSVKGVMRASLATVLLLGCTACFEAVAEPGPRPERLFSISVPLAAFDGMGSRRWAHTSDDDKWTAFKAGRVVESDGLLFVDGLVNPVHPSGRLVGFAEPVSVLVSSNYHWDGWTEWSGKMLKPTSPDRGSHPALADTSTLRVWAFDSSLEQFVLLGQRSRPEWDAGNLSQYMWSVRGVGESLVLGEGIWDFRGQMFSQLEVRATRDLDQRGHVLATTFLRSHASFADVNGMVLLIGSTVDWRFGGYSILRAVPDGGVREERVAGEYCVGESAVEQPGMVFACQLRDVVRGERVAMSESTLLGEVRLADDQRLVGIIAAEPLAVLVVRREADVGLICPSVVQGVARHWHASRSGL